MSHGLGRGMCWCLGDHVMKSSPCLQTSGFDLAHGSSDVTELYVVVAWDQADEPQGAQGDLIWSETQRSVLVMTDWSCSCDQSSSNPSWQWSEGQQLCEMTVAVMRHWGDKDWAEWVSENLCEHTSSVCRKAALTRHNIRWSQRFLHDNQTCFSCSLRGKAKQFYLFKGLYMAS